MHWTRIQVFASPDEMFKSSFADVSGRQETEGDVSDDAGAVPSVRDSSRERGLVLTESVRCGIMRGLSPVMLSDNM